MQIIKTISVLLFIITIVSIGCVTPYQPSISKENIPTTIPDDVRKQIEKLYSSDPVERAYGAYYLGKRGKEAVPAIPFLIGILGDRSRVEWTIRFPMSHFPTSPGLEAAHALIEIGLPALVPLLDSLKDEDLIALKSIASLTSYIDDNAVKTLLLYELFPYLQNRSEIRSILHMCKGNYWCITKKISSLEDKRSCVFFDTYYIVDEVKDVRTVDALVAALKKEKLNIVAKTYPFFIRMGVTDSEAILIRTLNKFGDTHMASAFLNCGNSRLIDAAKDWASRNGYKIVPLLGGGGGSRWGSR